MRSPDPRYGKPLAALRVLVALRDPARWALAAGCLSDLGVEPVWDPHRERLGERWDLILVDPRDPLPVDASHLPLLAVEPLDERSGLQERVRGAWECQGLYQAVRHFEASWQEAEREKATAEAQIERTERVLLASYTDLRDAHHALLAQNLELERALEEQAKARAQVEERERLLKQVVHDLRSDLFNISLAVHIGERYPDRADTFESIRESLQRINRFLEDKTRALRAQPDRRAARLHDLLAVATQVMAEQLALRGQQLSVARPDQDGGLAIAQVEAEQIVLNLLSNASKFSPVGSILRLEAWWEADQAVVRVEDEGPGIPADMLADIGTGRRADPSVAGSGLGLQNVLALLAGVGGRLQWRNGSRGAIFEARMPLLESEALAEDDGLRAVGDA